MTKEQQIYHESKKAGACELITGTESMDELIELFFTPKGIEFCTTCNAPSLHAFRRFRGMQATRGGFYIDTPVKARNLPRVALFGTTVAELEYDDPTKRHDVILMHGAKAKIVASGWAVVFVTNAGGTVDYVINDNAMII